MKRDYKAILEIKFDSDAGNGLTIRGYLHELLSKLWQEAEGFSGKRPFGNSGWEYDLYLPLVKHGHVKGDIDEDGFLDEFNEQEANDLVFELISFAMGVEVSK